MFCHKCGTQIAEGADFCHKCGTKVVYEDAGRQASDSSRINESASDTHTQGNAHSQGNIYSQDNTHFPSNTLQCPNCHSTDLIPITETNTNVSGGGYKVGKGCCGWILFGPLGLLCGLCGTGVKTQTQTRTYWVCKTCGNKFRNQADVTAEQAAEVMTGSANVLVGSIALFIAGNLFADYDINILGISNWIYIILGALGMFLGAIGILIVILSEALLFITENIDKPSKNNKSVMDMCIAVFALSFIALTLGVICAFAGGESLLWIPNWVYIVLGLLGTLLFGFVSDVIWTLGTKENGRDILVKKYGPLLDKIMSIFNRKK